MSLLEDCGFKGSSESGRKILFVCWRRKWKSLLGWWSGAYGDANMWIGVIWGQVGSRVVF
jgi:hypothetical protein